MRARDLDELVDEFASSGPGRAGNQWVGRRDLDVGRFYVAYNPGQLDGIFSKPGDETGTYVAYLGPVDERVRYLISEYLRPLTNNLMRFVGPSWRYYSWGIAERIAKSLGVTDAVPVKVAGREADHKVVTFLPASDVPKVRETVFAGGAGKYGLYSKCSFTASGKGTFYGEKGSKPAVGQAGKVEEVDEERLEIRVPQEKLGRVVAALRRAHPYEQPVIEVYETASGVEYGEGRTGKLANPLTAQAASRRIASVLGSQPVLSEGRGESDSVMVWDGEPENGLYEAALGSVGLYVGPDSRGLGKMLAHSSSMNVVEFPRYCFLMAGAKELVYMVREACKRESYKIKTFLPTRAGGVRR